MIENALRGLGISVEELRDVSGFHPSDTPACSNASGANVSDCQTTRPKSRNSGAKTLKSITLRLAAADEIRRMSGGEVTSEAALDESGVPVPGGLFCPRIFGEDGRGFGHIELACPVLHPWYEDIEMQERPVLEALPVVGPVMRPLVPGPGGAALSSDLNELYRRVISRNHALKELPSAGAYAADARTRLIDAVRSLILGDGALQSLTSMLAGENGLLKRNLAGKRQDYSGRSVIVSGPDLKMSQCGLPYEMALAQFKPFIARKLVELGLAADSSAALDKIDTDLHGPAVRRAAEQVVSERLILLNRAPTLHRLGIQPFEPVLVDHRSIALHPLVCYGFNADFDGDQMAVHVPVTASAQREARELLDSAVNLASPANGKPIAGPVQTSCWGCGI
jgi:DNA-directed RNA polymerase beta' subunit